VNNLRTSAFICGWFWLLSVHSRFVFVLLALFRG
jgi:hypothetical protein